MARRIDSLYYEVEARTRGFDRALKDSAMIGKKFAETITKHPIGAVVALGAAFTLLAVKATRMAAALEKSMAEVGTLVDKTTVDMGKLQDGVLRLFQNLPVESIEDLTSGLYQLISAGVPAAQALETLEIASKAAIGGVTDVRTAVDGLTTAVNAWSQQGLTAQEAADQFFTAVRLGKTTFAELSGSIGQTAGLAANLGVGLDDLLANMVALTQGGLQTSVAFTSLRQVLSNVIRPQETLRRDFPELAQQFTRTRLEADGLTKFLVDLAAATEGNDQAITKMFGSVEALNAVMAITADGGERVTGILQEMRTSTGAANRAYLEMSGNADALNQLLKNQLSVELLRLGNQILPAVNYGLRALTGLIAELNGSINAIHAERFTKTILTMARHLDALEGEDRIEALRRLREAMDGLIGGAGIRGVESLRNLERFTDEQIRALQAGLVILAQLEEGPGGRWALTQKLMRLSAERRARGLTPAGAEPGGPRPPPITPLTEEQTRAIAQAQTFLDEQGRTLVTEARRVLTDYRAEVEAAGVATNAAVRDALQALEQNLASAELTTAVQSRLRDLGTELDGIFAVERFAAAGAELERMEEELLALQATFEEGTEPWQRVQSAIEQVRAKQRQLADQVQREHEAELEQLEDRNRLNRENLRLQQDELDAIKRKREEQYKQHQEELAASRQRLLNLAGSLEAGIRGAAQLAQAMGMVSEETAEAMQNVAQLAAGVARIAAGDVVAGGLQAVGALAQLLMPRPDPEAERRHKEELEAMQQQAELAYKNTLALEELTRQIGEFGAIDLPGKMVAGAQKVLAKVLGSETFQLPGGVPHLELLQQELAYLGLTMTDLATVAERVGVSFAGTTPTLDELTTVLERLQAMELTRFAETFQGQMDALRAEFELFDITDPIEQLERLLEVMSDPRFGSPALREALAGLDLTTAEGRRQAEAAIQALFQQLREGTLDLEAMGGLTADEFLQALLDIERMLEEGTAATGGRTEGFAVQRTITEVTGSRIAGILSSGNLWLEQIEEHTRIAADLLRQIVLPQAVVQPSSVESGRVPSSVAGIEEVVAELKLELARAGISMAELSRMAEAMGVSFAATLPTFAELAELANRMAEANLTELARQMLEGELVHAAQILQDQMQKLRAEFALLDVSDPIAQLERLLEVMAEFALLDVSDPIAQLERLLEVMADPNFGSPALREALTGLNLTTADGWQQAEQAIQALVRQLREGTLDLEQMGGLRSDALLQALQERDRRTEDEIAAAVESGIIGTLASANRWLAAMEDHTRIATDLLRQLVVSPGRLQPPALPADMLIQRAGVSAEPAHPVSVGAITVNVSPPAGMSVEQAYLLGQAVTDGMVDEINRIQGARVKRRELQWGRIVRN